MRRRHLVVLLVLALSVLLLPGTALAGSSLQFKGKTAEAYFPSFDSSGCIVTEVFVFATEVRFHSNKPQSGDEYASVDVFISQYDICTDTLLLEASGSTQLGQGAFKVDKQLQTASVQASLSVLDDLSNTTRPVQLSLNWSGAGDLSRVKDHFSIQTEGFKITQRFDGTSRPAVATGAVTSGMTNYTPESSAFASIMSAKNGSVMVG